MRIFFYSFCVLSILMMTSRMPAQRAIDPAGSLTEKVSAYQSFEELARSGSKLRFDKVQLPATKQPPRAIAKADVMVTVFTDRAAFLSDCPGLATEDFEGAPVGPGGIISCGTVISSTTVNCYLGGELLPGFAFGSALSKGLVVLGAGAAGNPTTAVAPDKFDDDGIFTFSVPTTAAGFDLFGFNATTTTLIVSGPNGVLWTGSATIGSFIGFKVIGDVITSIAVDPQNQIQTVEVFDNLTFGNCISNGPPTAVCQTVTVDADANCQGTADAEDFDGGSTDPDEDELTFSVDPAGPYPLGTTPVVLTVSDGQATGTCETSITVEDNTPPSVMCSGGSVVFNGEASLGVSAIISSSAMDACGGVSGPVFTPATVSCSQVGQNVPVIVSYTDDNGNVGRCTTSVQVTGLPCGFMDSGGIGCTDQAGYNANTGTFTLQPAGCNLVSPNSDRQGFIQYELCGNGSIILRVAGVSSPSVFAGVSLRASLAPGAIKAEAGTNRTNMPQNYRLAVRETMNGVAYPLSAFYFNHFWMRLVRTGNNVAIYSSTNGQQWTLRLSRNLNLPNCVYIGMFAYGNGTATFDNVTTTGGSPLQTSPEEGGFPLDETSNFRLPLSDFRLYPNPTSGQLTVELPADLSLEGATLEVIDSYGRQLLRENNLDYRQQLDLGRLPAGAYLVRLQTTDGKRWLERVIVQARP